MKALVTGASGFVGAAVARALLDAGHTVAALIRADSNCFNLNGLQLQTFVGDICDVESLRAPMRGVDAVFHVAADYRLWVRNPESMYATNVEGTRNVIDAALECGVERVVYTSSVAALGAAGDDGLPVDETTAADLSAMVGHYKRSKLQAEQMVMQLVEKRGAPVVIVNPSTPLGPGDIRPTPTGKFILDAVEGRMPVFVDTGLNIVHVDDVGAGHLAALQRGEIGRRYILGGENLPLRDILAQVARQLGRRPPAMAIPHGLAMVIARAAEAVAAVSGSEPRATVDGVKMSKQRMYYSSDLAIAELGYRHRPASEAIAAAAAWFRSGYRKCKQDNPGQVKL